MTLLALVAMARRLVIVRPGGCSFPRGLALSGTVSLVLVTAAAVASDPAGLFEALFYASLGALAALVARRAIDASQRSGDGQVLTGARPNLGEVETGRELRSAPLIAVAAVRAVPRSDDAQIRATLQAHGYDRDSLALLAPHLPKRLHRRYAEALGSCRGARDQGGAEATFPSRGIRTREGNGATDQTAPPNIDRS